MDSIEPLRTNSFFTKDEQRVISDLAWMVKNSKQNVGLRMIDQANAVIKILKDKQPHEHNQEQQ